MALARIAGVHEAKSPKETAVRFPGTSWTHEFIAGAGGGALDPSTTAAQLAAKVAAKAGPAWAAGLGAVVSIKIDLAAAAAGHWDARLRVLGGGLVDEEIIIVIWHEPEDNMPAAVFAAGFHAARAALKAGWPGLIVAYAAMAYQWRPNSKTTTGNTGWADVEADLYLVDVYSGKSFPDTQTLAEHPGFVRWYVQMIQQHPDRLWGVAERGILAGPQRVNTINREAAWLTDSPVGRTCSLYLWWNTGGTENNPGWILDEAGERALAGLIARISAPVAPAQPVAAAAPGYRRCGLPGFVVSEHSGALVAEDMTDVHDKFLQALDAAA